jgi:hypothetical protein
MDKYRICVLDCITLLIINPHRRQQIKKSKSEEKGGRERIKTLCVNIVLYVDANKTFYIESMRLLFVLE